MDTYYLGWDGEDKEGFLWWEDVWLRVGEWWRFLGGVGGGWGRRGEDRCEGDWVDSGEVEGPEF